MYSLQVLPGFPAACLENGTFPNSTLWPECDVHCPVPEPADNYQPQVAATIPPAKDGNLTFRCLK